MTLSIDQVKTAHEFWYEANTRSNQRKQNERQRLEKEQQGEVVVVEVDLTDINALFEEKGQGPHLLEMEFEPVTEAPVNYVSARTGNETSRWSWRHKLTKTEVHRYRTKSGKSYDTGVLSHCLQILKEAPNMLAFQRAQHILKLNGKKKNRTVNESHDKPRLKREDMLKQWVSDLFPFCLFKLFQLMLLRFAPPCFFVVF
jgi:hypothetical protein